MKLVIFAFVFVVFPYSVFAEPICKGVTSESIKTTSAPKISDRNEGLSKEVLEYIKSNPQLKKDWQDSLIAIDAIKKKVYGQRGTLEAVLSAIISHGFIWLNGDPGGAKTYISKLLFKAELAGISEKDKKTFILQFHKLLSEGIIVGFPKLNKMLEEGKYEIDSSKSLVGDKFIFAIFDEVEKSSPHVLASLLSVLNERQAFVGAQVINAALRTGIFTSNKSIAELVQSFGVDRPAAEALLDRMSQKRHVFNQQLTPNERVELSNLVRDSQNINIKPSKLSSFYQVIKKMRLSKNVVDQIVSITDQLDSTLTPLVDSSLKDLRYRRKEAREYFTANQFSTRSMIRLVKTLKAKFLAHQLMKGIPFEKVRWVVEPRDLVHLEAGAILGGPGKIHIKGKDVKIKLRVLGAEQEIDAQWEPIESELRFNYGLDRVVAHLDLDTKKLDVAESHKMYFEHQDLTLLLKQLSDISNSHDSSQIEFEDDGYLSALIAKKTIPSKTKEELQDILRDRNKFITFLNIILQKPSKYKTIPSAQPLSDIEIACAKKLEKLLADENLSDEERVRYSWLSSQLAIKEFKSKYIELDHSITAHLVSLLGGQHLYVYGPPGGAKTSLARDIIDSELKNVRIETTTRFANEFLDRLKQEDKKEFDKFLLQFNKLTPDGVIRGFQDIKAQLERGEYAIDDSASLANPRFIFAILDEVEKANPVVLTALLSILNEKEVFHGFEKIRVALHMAVMTSNKTISEFLDGFGEDRSAGVAILDRAINKVYVPNKFTTPDQLSQFLYGIESSTKRSGYHANLKITELTALLDKVSYEFPIEKVAAHIFEDVIGSNLEDSELSIKKKQEDPRAFPDTYVPASTASDRTWLRMVDKQWKSSFLIDQLEKGISYEQLRTKMDFRDLRLFAQGLIYWGPYQIKEVSDPNTNNGVLSFELDSKNIDGFKQSLKFSERNKFMLDKISNEAKRFVDKTNSMISEIMLSLRETIAKYPSLFPELFADSNSRKNWVDSSDNSPRVKVDKRR